MSRHKLKKFAELQTFPNVFDNLDVRDPKNIVLNGQIVDIKGSWQTAYFKNNNPITLELACGRGEYAVALGKMFPERNFIGERKGNQGRRSGDHLLFDEVASAHRWVVALAEFSREPQAHHVSE